jgi:hypothetical protein
VRCAVWPVRDPENHCAVRIFGVGQLVERGAYKEEFPVGREHGHGGTTIVPVHRVHRVLLRACREAAFVIDRHQPDVVGAGRVHHEKRPTRRGIGQRFSATAFCVPRPPDVQQREPAFVTTGEAGDGIVGAVGGEQKATIRRENDTARTLVVVRPADVVDGAQNPRTGAPRGDTFHLGKRAVRITTIVDNGILGVVRLHVEVSATLI